MLRAEDIQAAETNKVQAELLVSNHREVARESLIRIRYQENAEVIKAASHVASKVRNTELKKRAAHQEVTKCSPRKCHIGRILGAEEIEQ